MISLFLGTIIKAKQMPSLNEVCSRNKHGWASQLPFSRHFCIVESDCKLIPTSWIYWYVPIQSISKKLFPKGLTEGTSNQNAFHCKIRSSLSICKASMSYTENSTTPARMYRGPISLPITMSTTHAVWNQIQAFTTWIKRITSTLHLIHFHRVLWIHVPVWVSKLRVDIKTLPSLTLENNTQ